LCACRQIASTIKQSLTGLVELSGTELSSNR
jgi:hypothetical protein